MNMEFPYQNQSSEKVWHFNKIMDSHMKEHIQTTVKVSEIQQYIIGDVYSKHENGKIKSILHRPSTIKCRLCR